MSVTVTNQEEFDAAIEAGEQRIIIDSPHGVWLRVGESSSVVARGSSSVEAWGSSSVEARDSSSVVAWDSSSVEAWDSSSVEARGSSSVVARDSSSVVAWGSSSVVAWDSSSVEAWDSSSVEARDSSSVVAWESSSVVAWGSSSVVAWGSSSVEARDSSSVVAWGSSSVEARESSSVEARGSSSVEARGSSRVEARDSSSVEASKFVAVHLHSASATVTGGVVIDITALDLTGLDDWAEYHGVKVEGGEAIVYKAVDADLCSGRGFAYPIGETVVCPDWSAEAACGNGLHLSPSPAEARAYFRGATRFLRCAVPVGELVIIDGEYMHMIPKLKAKTVRVICEVDVHGREIK